MLSLLLPTPQEVVMIEEEYRNREFKPRVGRSTLSATAYSSLIDTQIPLQIRGYSISTTVIAGDLRKKKVAKETGLALSRCTVP
jgi:hypothetical protein